MTLFSQPELAPLRFRVLPSANAAVIVAHPDDETLWAGGMMLTHPGYNWFVTAVCRKSDPDRSVRFFKAMQSYGAKGILADLDDGPEQVPLSLTDIQQVILQLLPALAFDLVLTHAPGGEYTRHRRHEEVSQAVIGLWQAGAISTKELRLFAYEDDDGSRFPMAIEAAHHYNALPEAVRQEKYRLITEVYGFRPESWEAQGMPRSEAFWCFESPNALQAWLVESRRAW
jgi:LmbE family N-acetylglucosaminyl deacetylase